MLQRRLRNRRRSFYVVANAADAVKWRRSGFFFGMREIRFRRQTGAKKGFRRRIRVKSAEKVVQIRDRRRLSGTEESA